MTPNIHTIRPDGGTGSLRVAPPPCVVRAADIEVRYQSNGSTVLMLERLEILEGERVAIVGSSGSGKTTLLRLINGYVRPTTGSLEILGQRMSGRRARAREVRRRVGFIFQSFNLVERATVLDNVLWGRLGHVRPWMSLVGKFSEDDRQLAMEAIEEVDLLPQLHQRADTLSTGQQQRVAVARVLAQKAELILADEPVSNLDPSLAEETLQLLGEVASRHGATLVMSLHQPQLAQRFAARMIGLRRGRLVHDGPSDSWTADVARSIYDRKGAAVADADGRRRSTLIEFTR